MGDNETKLNWRGHLVLHIVLPTIPNTGWHSHTILWQVKPLIHPEGHVSSLRESSFSHRPQHNPSYLYHKMHGAALYTQSMNTGQVVCADYWEIHVSTGAYTANTNTSKGAKSQHQMPWQHVSAWVIHKLTKVTRVPCPPTQINFNPTIDRWWHAR